MAEALRPLEIMQLEEHLKQEFSGHINGVGHKALDKERNFLRHSLLFGGAFHIPWTTITWPFVNIMHFRR